MSVFIKGVLALKYKMPDGVWRIVSMEYDVLQKPQDGWGHRIYIPITSSLCKCLSMTNAQSHLFQTIIPALKKLPAAILCQTASRCAVVVDLFFDACSSVQHALPIRGHCCSGASSISVVCSSKCASGWRPQSPLPRCQELCHCHHTSFLHAQV